MAAAAANPFSSHRRRLFNTSSVGIPPLAGKHNSASPLSPAAALCLRLLPATASMAASQESANITSSRCSPEKAWGRHIFEVTGYSLLKGQGVGVYVESATFTVGGRYWRIIYSPDGDYDFEDYASVILLLLDETSDKVRVLVDLRLLNPATGVSTSVFAGDCVLEGLAPTTPSAGFIKRSELEESYLRDDRIVIECDLTVILDTPESKPRSICEIQVPPSDVLDNLGKLLESGEGADLTFVVQDEVFHAHKLVLAMRSPVFKAEFFGPMSGSNGKDTVRIEDTLSAVFLGLLHFIYNDSLPEMDDLLRDENVEMVKHLLVAADRYAMERMKVVCESILSKKLTAENVASTIALADQHHCSQLKDACISFINSFR